MCCKNLIHSFIHSYLCYTDLLLFNISIGIMTKARGFGRGTSKRALLSISDPPECTSSNTNKLNISDSINQPFSEPSSVIASQEINQINRTNTLPVKCLTRGRGRTKLATRLAAPSSHWASATPIGNHEPQTTDMENKLTLVQDSQYNSQPLPSKFEDKTGDSETSKVQKCSLPNSHHGNFSQRSNQKNITLGRSRLSGHSISSLNKAMEKTELPHANSNRPLGGERCFNFSYKEPEIQTASPPQSIAIQSLGDGKHVLCPMNDGIVSYSSKFYEKHKADKLFYMLLNSLNFETHSKKRGDEIIKQPRLCIWFAPEDMPYSYSYVTLKAHQFSSNSIMSRIKSDVEEFYGCTFNSCLVNLYRDNKDSVGWHADDEKSLGSKPTIASLSFGETRRFELCQKNDNLRKPVYGFNLEHGSGLLMKGDVQERWLHCVPKEYHDRKPRLNLTFRTIFPTR